MQSLGAGPDSPLFGHIFAVSGAGLTSIVYFEFRELWLRATVSHRYTLKMLEFDFSSSQDFVDPAAYPSKSVCVLLSLALVCRLLTLNLYHPLTVGTPKLGHC